MRPEPWEEPEISLPAEAVWETALPQRVILTVSELTQQIRALLTDHFPDVWVEGEIQDFRTPNSGHLYFTLKDAQAQIRAVLFRNAARSLRFQPADGLHVICRGRVDVYERRGEYQLVVDYMEPKGIGALQLAFEQLKEKLAKEGLFDSERKRPIPLLPRRIGVVTSPTGAAIRDILNVLRRRFANVDILISPTSVQGDRAVPEIVEALAALNAIPDVEVIIVARGGGSLEDLWAFNEEAVARAIAASRVPVISAVGHEVDYTIADFVADLRAPTPSAAAEMVVRNKLELARHLESLRGRMIQYCLRTLEVAQARLGPLQGALPRFQGVLERRAQVVDDLRDRLNQAVQRLHQQYRDRVVALHRHLYLVRPEARLAERRRRLGHLWEQMVRLQTHALEMRRARLREVVGRLDSLSPLAVLARGYSITQRLPDFRVVTRADQVSPGDQVWVRLHQGQIRCRVEGEGKMEQPRLPLF